MRILTIGALTFIAWSTLSTYLYVCKIKGLCIESVTMPMSETNTENTIIADTLLKLNMEKSIAIPKDLIIYFAFDKSEFTPNSVTGKYFTESNAYLNQNKLSILKITGYTDAIGLIGYNQSLGYRRADKMQQYFKSKGIPSDKIVILSKGENEPADNNNTVDGRAKNRRAVITINK